MPIGPLPVVARPGSRWPARAALVGLTVVGSAGLSAAPALAAQLAGANVLSAVPDVVVSSTVHVQLAAAPAPADLDLSGARFDVVDGSGAVVGSCDTDATGACDVPVAPVAGTTYRLVQDASTTVPGLVPSTAETALLLCSPDAADCVEPTVTVTDASQFRTALTVTVRDGATQAPVAGAEYSLTGPDYRHAPVAPQEADTTVLPTPTLSGPDGTLTFAGWFLPGEWGLFPEVTPRGYASSGVLPLTLPAPTVGSGDPWTDTVELAPDAIALTGPGGGPARPPVVPPKPGPAAPPTTTARPRPSRAAAARVRSAIPPSAPAVARTTPPARAVVPTPAAPTVSASVPPPDAGDSTPSAGAAPPATDSPPLRAEASASRLDVGVIGFGVLFLALVVVGVGALRQRARRP